MSLADWLIALVAVIYLVIGCLFAVQHHEPLFLGLYGFYAGANVFLILIGQALRR